MKAIVLTYDRNRIVTDHMIACYERLWPDHPFIFRIPYQNKALNLKSQRREYVRTSSDIRNTVLTLLEGLDDDEWIYWCMDDKYPIALELDRVKAVFTLTQDRSLDHVSSLLFCRAHKTLTGENLFPEFYFFNDIQMYKRRAYYQIWIHQFARVKVYRHLFASFPNQMPAPLAMDAIKDQMAVPLDHNLFVTSRTIAVFGESTSCSVLTENCKNSLLLNGFTLPDWHHSKTTPETIYGSL